MISTKQEFPHPLLAGNRTDYTSGSFSLHIDEHNSDNKEFFFKLHYELDCPGIEKLVNEGKAKVFLRLKSSATSYREKKDFDPDTHQCSFAISKLKVAKTIFIKAYIVTANKITKFSLPEHNPLYFRSTVFDLRKGDILAESALFEVRLDDTELEKPLSSIFKISQFDEDTESVVANFNNEFIRIFLAPRLYAIYYNLRKKGELRRYLSAVIVIPALIEALSIMQTEPSTDYISYENYRWYRTIEKKLEKLNIDLDETELPLVSIANKLLGDISWDALNSLKTTIDDINKNSETIEPEWRD
jgi:hypothetical protein